MTLEKLLSSINKKDALSKKLLAADSGTKFEKKIIEKLLEDATYVTVDKKDYQKSDYHKDLKEIITSSNVHPTLIKAPGINSFFRFGERRVLVSQPHGKNNYPDFLLFHNDIVLPLEIKFSKEKGEKPTWNGGYPRSQSIYIFGSYGKQDATAFVGDEYLSEVERNAMISIMEKAENEMTKQTKIIHGYNPENFYVYLRRMYTQKKSSLSHVNRKKLEASAIKLAKSGMF